MCTDKARLPQWPAQASTHPPPLPVHADKSTCANHASHPLPSEQGRLRKQVPGYPVRISRVGDRGPVGAQADSSRPPMHMQIWTDQHNESSTHPACPFTGPPAPLLTHWCHPQSLRCAARTQCRSGCRCPHPVARDSKPDHSGINKSTFFWQLGRVMMQKNPMLSAPVQLSSDKLASQSMLQIRHVTAHCTTPSLQALVFCGNLQTALQRDPPTPSRGAPRGWPPRCRPC